MKTLIYGENHSEKNSLDRNTELLAGLPRDKATIYHEALPRGWMEKSAEAVLRGKITFDEFWRGIGLEEHWAPADNYKPFYQTAFSLGFELRGLDQEIEFRYLYAREFRDWTIQALEVTTGDRAEELKVRFDWLRAWVSPARELMFAQVVAADAPRVADKGGIQVVVTHPLHIQGVKTNLRMLGIDDITVSEYPEAQRIENGKKEDAIQLAAARRQNILERRYGSIPIVPAIVLAFDVFEKLGKNGTQRADTSILRIENDDEDIITFRDAHGLL